MGQRPDREIVDPGGRHLGRPLQGESAGCLQQHGHATQTARGAPPPPYQRSRSCPAESVRRRPPSLRRTGRGCRPPPRAGSRNSASAPPRWHARTDPAAATWLSLISAASPRLIRWLTPPPHRTAYFSSARNPGSVLRVSRICAPVPATASTQVRVARRDSGQVGQQVQRGSLGRQDALGRPGQGQRRLTGHQDVAVRHHLSPRSGRSEHRCRTPPAPPARRPTRPVAAG